MKLQLGRTYQHTGRNHWPPSLAAIHGMNFQFDHWELSHGFSRASKSSKRLNRIQRRVCYSDQCSVILIPSREEYEKAGIQLWYTPETFGEAITEMMSEVETCMSMNPAISRKDALKTLYNHSTYDQDDSNDSRESSSFICPIDNQETNSSTYNVDTEDTQEPATSFTTSTDSTDSTSTNTLADVESICT